MPLAEHAPLLLSALSVAIALATYVGARLRDAKIARDEKARAGKLVEEEQARTLERAESKGRADALRAVQESERAELLSLLKTAHLLLGHPEEMMAWQADVQRRLSALDGEGVSATGLRPVTIPPSSSSVKTSSESARRR